MKKITILLNGEYNSFFLKRTGLSHNTFYKIRSLGFKYEEINANITENAYTQMIEENNNIHYVQHAKKMLIGVFTYERSKEIIEMLIAMGIRKTCDIVLQNDNDSIF